MESALNGEAVHFILPLTTAWVERENISQRFIFQHPQHDIELGGSIMGKGGVPTTTPPVDSSNEHSRKSRAAWGQGEFPHECSSLSLIVSLYRTDEILQEQRCHKG